MKNKMIRVFIADDHNLFREGVITLLEKQNDIIVVGEAEDGFSLIAQYNEKKPNILLTDISMPGKSGPDAVKSITNGNKDIKVLFLSQYTSDDYIYAVIQSGGDGLLSKNCMKSELILAIKTVMKGEKYFLGKTQKELDAIMNRFNLLSKKKSKENTDALTKKEKEVLILVGENYSSKAIAEKLKISIRTVDSHRMNIMAKLQLKSLPGLIVFARDYVREQNTENL
ncbi:MAG: response regulator transcription factor [Melioribacteraceae bacterium]